MAINIPRFTLPAFVSLVGKKLQHWPHAIPLITALSAALQRKILHADR